MSNRAVKPLTLLLGVPVILAGALFTVTLDQTNSMQPMALVSDRGLVLPEPEEIPVIEKFEITTKAIELPAPEEIPEVRPNPLPMPQENIRHKLAPRKIAERRIPRKIVPRKRVKRKHVSRKPDQSWSKMMAERYDGVQNFEGYHARFDRIK